MFKKGQLVKSIKFGFTYIVCVDEICGHDVRVRTHGGVHGTLNARDITLIGNNYQAKQKCSR